MDKGIPSVDNFREQLFGRDGLLPKAPNLLALNIADLPLLWDPDSLHHVQAPQYSLPVWQSHYTQVYRCKQTAGQWRSEVSMSVRRYEVGQPVDGYKARRGAQLGLRWFSKYFSERSRVITVDGVRTNLIPKGCATRVHSWPSFIPSVY